VISLRRLAVTSLVVDLAEEKSPSKETLAAALKAADVEGKWAASSWGTKIAKAAARKNLTDFDRYLDLTTEVWNLEPYTLNHTSCTLHPMTLNPEFSILNQKKPYKPETRSSKSTRPPNPQPLTLNSKLPKPLTSNPKP
jgi:folate-dependent tRNA-U54 methylase TrmFO/GidA